MSPPGVMFVLSSTLCLSRLCLCPIFDQTGRTDIPLTQLGESQIKSKAIYLVGDGSGSNLIAPRSLLIIFLQSSLTRST
jgi:hypothetical protein